MDRQSSLQACAGSCIQAPQRTQVPHQRVEPPAWYLGAQVSVDTVTPLLACMHRLDTFLQHDLLGRLGKTLIGQPSPVVFGPSRFAGRINPLMAEQKRTELLACGPHRPHRRQTGADQVAHGLMRGIWNPDVGQQAATVGVARAAASRSSFFRRSPLLRGIIDGATTTQSSPDAVSVRWTP